MSNNAIIPESFNTNILHKFLDYKINFENSQQENTNSKGDHVLTTKKSGFKGIFKDF